jgi:hypothetical protein
MLTSAVVTQLAAHALAALDATIQEMHAGSDQSQRQAILTLREIRGSTRKPNAMRMRTLLVGA